jgi:hypothetical protein
MHASSGFLSRLGTLVGALTLAGLIAGAAMAFAGSQGDQGGSAAYALVDPNGGSPRLIGAHTSGFTAVTVGGAGQGDYCLTPAAGIDVVHTAAVASEEANYSFAAGFVLVRYQPNTPNCAPGQLEVKTFDQSVALSNQIAFTVNVP